jgi:hypothetical protein
MIFTSVCFAQLSTTALPFLLISPYTEANGMGEASVANHTDDPLALVSNPAHLGIVSQNNYFSFGHNFSNWLPAFNLSDLWYRTFAFNAGISLKKLDENGLPLSFGVGYSRIYLNLGTFTRTSLEPTPLETLEAFESSDQFTVGIGVDYWIKGSVGMTYKHVVSHLAPFGTAEEQGTGEGRANLYDYGLLVDVPILDITSRLSNAQFQLLPHLTPFLDFSIGLSRNNFGQETISYTDRNQADPLPRNARAGIGFNFGFRYMKDEAEWRPLTFKWTIEASAMLAKSYPETGYKTGFGDIKFFHELVLGKTNRETEKKKGWELNFLELLSIRSGRFEEDPTRGNRHFNTSGWGLRFAGFAKLLRAMGGSIVNEGLVGFIVNHFDVRYNHSQLTTDGSNNALSGTKFDSFNIFIMN